MDGLDRQALSTAQQAGFPDLWGKANVEDSGYIVHKEVLYSIWTPSSTSPDYPRIVLPPEFQDAVIDRAHVEVGHMATQKTMARLREAYVWPHMRASVKARLNKCAICAVHHRRQEHVAMGDMPLPPTPMQVVAVDLIGPFVASSHNNKYVFTVIDHCSGWAEAYPIPDKRSETIEHFFHNRFVASHGCPEIIISDNGAEFTAKHWTAYLQKMDIKHIRCTPQHPQSNGKIERFNRTFKEMLAKAVNNSPGDWEDHVGSTLFSHHISVSDVTHYSPFYLLYGRQPRAPLSKLLHSRDLVQGLGTRVDNLSTALKAARVYSEDARKYNKARYAKKANDSSLSAGDMVVLLAPEPLTLTSKWDPQWQVTRISGTTVFLRHQQSGQVKKVHRSKVKLVDPDMVWDDIAPRPRRRQQRGTPVEVPVDIHVDPPQATMPPCGDTQSMGNPQVPLSPQSSVPDENRFMETETPEEHPSPWTQPRTTPVVLPEVTNGLDRARPIRTRLHSRESERANGRAYKRELSPPEASTSRYNTRWSSLSEEEKRRKRVRYDVLAGRVNALYDIGTVFTIPETGYND